MDSTPRNMIRYTTVITYERSEIHFSTYPRPNELFGMTIPAQNVHRYFIAKPFPSSKHGCLLKFPSSEGLIVENRCADVFLQRHTLETSSSLNKFHSKSLRCNGDKARLPVSSSGIVSYLKRRSCALVYRTFGNCTPIHLEPQVVHRHPST